jgi:hypothetical protein
MIAIDDRTFLSPQAPRIRGAFFVWLEFRRHARERALICSAIAQPDGNGCSLPATLHLILFFTCLLA